MPDVAEEETLEVETLGHGFYRVIATYGFMETPNVPEIMRVPERARHRARARWRRRTTSAASGSSPTGKARDGRAGARSSSSLMSRNARSATEFFGIPPNRVVELGTQIEF